MKNSSRSKVYLEESKKAQKAWFRYGELYSNIVQLIFPIYIDYSLDDVISSKQNLSIKQEYMKA